MPTVKETFEREFSVFLKSFREIIERHIPDKPFFTLQETADLFGVSKKTVRRWVKYGKIRATLIESGYRIPREELIKFATSKDSYLI